MEEVIDVITQKADFNELIERIKAGRFGHASFEPIFYLVFACINSGSQKTDARVGSKAS